MTTSSVLKTAEHGRSDLRAHLAIGAGLVLVALAVLLSDLALAPGAALGCFAVGTGLALAAATRLVRRA